MKQDFLNNKIICLLLLANEKEKTHIKNFFRCSRI